MEYIHLTLKAFYLLKKNSGSNITYSSFKIRRHNSVSKKKKEKKPKSNFPYLHMVWTIPKDKPWSFLLLSHPTVGIFILFYLICRNHLCYSFFQHTMNAQHPWVMRRWKQASNSRTAVKNQDCTGFRVSSAQWRFVLTTSLKTEYQTAHPKFVNPQRPISLISVIPEA